MSIYFYDLTSGDEFSDNEILQTPVNPAIKSSTQIPKHTFKIQHNQNALKAQKANLSPNDIANNNLQRNDNDVQPNDNAQPNDNVAQPNDNVVQANDDNAELNNNDKPNDNAQHNANHPDIVRVLCKTIGHSSAIPWTSNGVGEKSSTGFAVLLEDKVFIMSNAHAVKDCMKDMQNKRVVQLATSDNHTFTGEVVMENDFSDLSLIRPVEDNAVSKLKTVATKLEPFNGRLADIKCAEIGSNVEIHGFPFGLKSATVTSGKITSVGSVPYALSGVKGLTFTTDASVNGGNSGGPVKDENGNLIGVIFEGQGENTSYMIPREIASKVAYRYLSISNKDKSKFVDMSYLVPNLMFQPLDQRNLRDFLSLDECLKQNGIDTSEKSIGVRIKKVCPMVEKDTELKKEDIVTKIDGHNVLSDGTFLFNGNAIDMESMYMLLSEDNPKIKMQVLRGTAGNKKMVEIEHPCKRSGELVPKYLSQSSSEYCVIGGGVILPLTTQMVIESVQSGDPSVDELNAFKNGFKNKPAQQAVVLSKILPLNLCSESFGVSNVLISKINGRNVYNINDVVLASRYPQNVNGKEFIILETNDNDIIALTSESTFEEDNHHINTQMGIPHPGYSCEMMQRLVCGCKNTLLDFGKSSISCRSCKQTLADLDFGSDSIAVKYRLLENNSKSIKDAINPNKDSDKAKIELKAKPVVEENKEKKNEQIKNALEKVNPTAKEKKNLALKARKLISSHQSKQLDKSGENKEIEKVVTGTVLTI